jgi:hypothetical protein
MPAPEAGSGHERGTFANRVAQSAITRVAVPRRANGPDPKSGTEDHGAAPACLRLDSGKRVWLVGDAFEMAGVAPKPRAIT